MDIEKIALAEIEILDEILEDISLSRARHKSIINSVKIIKSALLETSQLRDEIITLHNTKKG